MLKASYQVEMVGGTSAELRVYGDIGSMRGGVTAASVVEQLAGRGELKDITVRINTAGGNPHEAVAIYNELVRHKAKVTTVNEGMALSAGSVIFLAGDERVMNSGSVLMIHEPSIAMRGTAVELHRAAKALKAIKDSVIALYADRSGSNLRQISRWMKEEKYFTADDAVSSGFATKTGQSMAIALHVDADELPEAIRPLLESQKQKEPDMAEETTVETTEEVAPEQPKTITMSIEEYEALKAQKAPEPESTEEVADDGDVKLAERNRVQAIHAVCEMAGIPAEKEKEFIDNGTEATEVSLYARKHFESTDVSPEGDADPDSDPDMKFKNEYQENKRKGIRMSATEEEYVLSRRIDEGLEVLA